MTMSMQTDFSTEMDTMTLTDSFTMTSTALMNHHNLDDMTASITITTTMTDATVTCAYDWDPPRDVFKLTSSLHSDDHRYDHIHIDYYSDSFRLFTEMLGQHPTLAALPQ
jgi:hypothetical protein